MPSSRGGTAARRRPARSSRNRHGSALSRFARTLAIRPGEGRLVGLLAAVFVAAEAGRGMGEVGVYTLVSVAPGLGVLPLLFIALGITGLVATLGYGMLLARVSRARLFPGMLIGLALLLLVERLLAAAAMPFVNQLLWVTVLAAGALTTTALWTVAGAVFHARQAKRLFPLCTSAAIAGSFGGLLLAGPLTRLVGSEGLVVGQAVLLLVAGGLLTRIAARLHQPSAAPAGAPRPAGVATGLRGGAAYVAGSPLMRLVAVAYLLFAVLLFSADLPFQSAMKAAFPDEADYATALGTLMAAVTGTSFLASTLVANRLYTRLGVATVALALPLVYLGGFVLWLAAYSVATAILFRFAQQVTQRGLSNAAWSAFFSVVPATRRGPVLAFIDGVPGQIGTVLSGVLLLVAASLGTQQVFVLGVVAAAVCVLVVWRIRRLYAASLVETLRSGLAEQVLEGGPGLSALTRSPGVVTDLRAALRGRRPGERRLAVELLSQVRHPDAVSDLLPLLDDDDRTVRLATLDGLVTLGSPDTLDAVLARLGDTDGEVRARALQTASAIVSGGTRTWRLDPALETQLAADADPRVVAELAVLRCRTGRTDEGRDLVDRLLATDDIPARVAGLDAIARIGGSSPVTPIEAALAMEEPLVRAAAVRALGALEPAPAIDARLVAMLSDPADTVRRAAAHALHRRTPIPAGVLTVLATGTESAQDAALQALDGDDVDAHHELVAWAIGQVDRARRLRHHAALLAAAADTEGHRHGLSSEAVPRPASGATDGHAAVAASTSFLAFLLRRRSTAIELRLLRALAILGAPEASGLIRRCLHTGDTETRAQAIEALDALGDGRLARAVVRLLDSEPVTGDDLAPDAAAVARALLDDPDGWVRALAIRTLGAHLAQEQRAVTARAAGDPDPIVRAAIGGILPGGPSVPETRATLDELERMLFLRGVPLFSMLAPEDLQRLAATATERAYAAGEALVTQGELGDELIVIVEGAVDVVKDEGGERRLLRSYATGDHIGELAVLREGSRAATVIAHPPGVRGLVIGGAGLKAILRERPEAAMAMLGTLAERISTS